jgi:hypothetical protein
MFATSENSHAQSSLIIANSHRFGRNDMQSFYSIIISSHNPRPDYLRRTLSALEQQTLAHERWELLMIQSSDSTI